ncbi:hypothetical protein FBU30_001621 [Linnemannia zychae]|nr:hypothetical protein FBU30_001621 [Linnemannia zychae]
MSSYRSTFSGADEGKAAPTASDSAVAASTKKRARSASQGLSSQDESSSSKKTTTQSAVENGANSTTATASASAAVNLRKEQNRAAQRAFRDRKERHLQQLENLIQDLKDQQFLLTTRFQREIQQLKTQNQVIVQENQYLREVVFAFESALNYRGEMEVLQDVKQGLYRRYVNRLAQKQQNLERDSQQQQQPLPPLASVPVSPSHSVASSQPSLSPSQQDVTTAQFDVLFNPLIASTTLSAIPSAIPPINDHSNINGSLSSNPSFTGKEPLLTPDSQVKAGTGVSQVSSLSSTKAEEAEETSSTPYSINREILYRVPTSLQTSEVNGDNDNASSQATIRGGLLAAATTATMGGVVPLSPYFPAGTPLPKVTDYTKHPTVFDELQSSLFPPGALQSIINTNMSSPQDVMKDTALLDGLGEKQEDLSMASEPLGNTIASANSTATTTRNSQAKNNIVDTSTSKSSDMESTQTTHWSRTEILQKAHRLQKSLRVLAAGPLKVDNKIDQQIYQIPHDSRINLIPCPKLRAQMILHQHKYDIEEVLQLLLDKAICHGDPLQPSHWELPEEFFERYGFLIGIDLENQRRKVWPRPLPPDML